MGERCYYACSATVGCAECFYLWFSDDIDGVLLDGDRICTFPSRDALAEYCAQANLPLTDEPTARYDFDALDAWIGNPHDADLDVHTLLNAWNMMDDFYCSLRGESAIADENLDLHEKLSLSNFAVSLPGAIGDENYDPNWTTSDRSRLASILDETTARFKAAL